MIDAYKESFAGHPSITHRRGWESYEIFYKTSLTTAKFINYKPNELVFTHNGTEANNLAILFKSHGRAINIAVSSILTEMLKGKNQRIMWKISWKDVSSKLGGLPGRQISMRRYGRGCFQKGSQGILQELTKPEWFPEELTAEERYVIEEGKAHRGAL